MKRYFPEVLHVCVLSQSDLSVSTRMHAWERAPRSASCSLVGERMSFPVSRRVMSCVTHACGCLEGLGLYRWGGGIGGGQTQVADRRGNSGVGLAGHTELLAPSGEACPHGEDMGVPSLLATLALVHKGGEPHTQMERKALNASARNCFPSRSWGGGGGRRIGAAEQTGTQPSAARGPGAGPAVGAAPRSLHQDAHPNSSPPPPGLSTGERGRALLSVNTTGPP